jgi:L-asparaginase/Glu-tRNA(Gln) amidotransferase subunit D
MTRPVRLLAAGGTIAMRGTRAVPALDGNQLIERLPGLAGEIHAESVLSLPSAQLTLTQSLELAQRAARAAQDGEGVVITTGTDTMEELAPQAARITLLCCLGADLTRQQIADELAAWDAQPG